MVSQDLLRQLNNLGGGWPHQGSARFDLLWPVVADDVRQLFVDPVNGSDENDGLTTATALATIQAAVLRFKQPWHMPVWGEGDDRTITVVHSAGLIIGESIVVPAHSGPGALIIEGQEEVVESGLVLDNPVFSTIAGFGQRRTLNFTTSPLTPSALADNAFVRGSQLADTTVFDQVLENLPIVDNGAGDAAVTVVLPGSFSAFTYTAGASVDIVRPQTVWRPAPPPDVSFVAPTAITNLGGGLLVRGFFFEPKIVGLDRSILAQGALPYGDTLLSAGTSFTRCVIRNNGSRDFTTICSGTGGVYLGGCLILGATNAISTVSERADLGITNVRAKSGLLIFEGGRTEILGLDWESDNTAILNLIFRGGKCAALRADVRGDSAVLLDQQAYVFCSALSVEDATQDAVQVIESSVLELIGGAAIQGTSGNTAHGAFIGDQSLIVATNKATMTLGGTSGELKVGGNAAQNWSAGAATDGTTNLARYS